MQLTMTVLRCPDTVVPETRSFTGGEFTVGRGPGVDWVLPDPERVLSKHHFAVAFRGGGWQLADTSVNGIFVNRESTPVGAGDIRNLRDGDRLRLGAYEIEVRLEDVAGRAAKSGSPFSDPFAQDPFGPARPQRNPFDEPDRPSLRAPPTSAQLPPDFDPLASESHERAFRGPTQPDHSPVMEDAVRVPAQIGQLPLHAGGAIPGDDLLPADWDKELLEGIAPLGDAAAKPPAAPERPVAREVTARAPEPRAAAQPEPTPPAPETADAGLLAAFLKGAGLSDEPVRDPAATMRILGKAFRSMVSGLRATLIARAQVKSAFRIGQTMMQARGNNPLKFAGGDEDAMATLLGSGRRSDMTADEAVTDALRDIRLHELATMAAMQAAVRAVLQGLDPAKLRAAAEQGGMTLLPAQKKARAWDAYEALHTRTVQALADDFDSVFGRAFARAYERALAEIAATERE